MQPPSGAQQRSGQRCFETASSSGDSRPHRRLPPLPELFNTNTALATQATLGGDDLQLMMEETQMDAVSFAWDQITS